MFNIKKWINSAPKLEDAEFVFRGEKVKVRALRGNDWEKYVKTVGNPEYNSASLVLYYGLIDEETGGRFALEDIEKLYEHYTAEAGELALKIIEMSRRIIAEENRVLEIAEKNSVSPSTDTSTSNGVGTTD